jgi:predicted RNA-binding Zn-ribbon protein involved in translation (DUF1610 family)
MYWRIQSFPELEHLPPEAREQMVQRSMGWANSLRLLLWVAFIAGLWTLIIGGLAGLLFLPRRGLPPWWYLGLWAFFAVASYQYRLIRIRGQLIMFLEKTARHKPLPMCLRCGYDLKGLTASRCPECGQRIPRRAGTHEDQSVDAP